MSSSNLYLFSIQFFPIPSFSLILLSITRPQRLERIGNNIVHSIFFTKLSLGKFHITLFHFFLLAAFSLFGGCTYNIYHAGNDLKVCKDCKFEKEIYWCTKAVKFRDQRNFWLSLFNLLFWFLVFSIHNLKGKVIQLKDRNNRKEKKGKVVVLKKVE